MSRAGKLDEAALGNPLGKVSPCLAGCDGVVLAVEHERWNANRREQPTNVHRRVGARERDSGARTRGGLVIRRQTPDRRRIRIWNELACQLLTAPGLLQFPVA